MSPRLAKTGGPTGWSMFMLDRGIEEFQKKNSLQVDDTIRPNFGRIVLQANWWR